MQDRLSTYPGRVKLEPVTGATNTYDLTRADVPTQEGTPLNKSTLLMDSTATLMGLGATATPNDMFDALAKKTTKLENDVANLEAGGGVPAVIPIERGGTGATTVAEARANLGISDSGGGSISGTVQINQGGTGATTATQALNNLGITWGTSSLTAGSSYLETGKIYARYV